MLEQPYRFVAGGKLPSGTRLLFIVGAITLCLLFGSGSPIGSAPTAWAAEEPTPSDPILRWEPVEPIQGTAFIVHVVLPEGDGAGKAVRVTGVAAGEPLHFIEEDGGFWALAGAPLDRGDSLSVAVVVTLAEGGEITLEDEVSIRSGNYAMERLTVAPQFVEPDPTVAERQARERERAAAVSRLAHETPRMWKEVLLPRDAIITSPFGTGREFNGQVQSRHTGVDFRGAVGAPVYAAADGVVALVDAFYLAGNVVYINHGGGLVTGYFHLSEALVAEGDRVRAGDPIARAGATGRVTGPHLHWQVRYGGISIDGMSLIDVLQGR